MAVPAVPVPPAMNRGNRSSCGLKRQSTTDDPLPLISCRARKRGIIAR